MDCNAIALDLRTGLFLDGGAIRAVQQKQIDFVSKVAKGEEEAFLRTLDKGLKRIDDIIKSSADKTINGKHAFELYDTYGFPIDLTRLIAAENNLAVDEKEFGTEMQQQKNRSRAATASPGVCRWNAQS